MNNDGIVSAADAVVISNFLRRSGSVKVALNLQLTQPPKDAAFYDVNGDGFATAKDLLEVTQQIGG